MRKQPNVSITKLCGVFSSQMGAGQRATAATRMVETFHLGDAAGGAFVEVPDGAMAGAGPACACDSGGQASGPNGSMLLSAGNCYNIRQLADEFKASPVSMAATDADLMAAALAVRGPGAVEQFIGEFALIFYDAPARTVLVANDRYGFCPLYFHVSDEGPGRTGRTLLVASECKAIRGVTGPLDYDPAAYGDFFYVGYVLGDRTLFRQVKALGPGEYLLWSIDGVVRKRYWHPSQVLVAHGAEVSPRQIHDTFDAAVARRLQPDKTQTLLLSGGFDSRLILGALLAQNQRPRIVTLTLDYPPGHQETELVRRLMRAMNLECEVRTAGVGHLDSALGLEVFHALDGMYPTFDLLCSRLYALIQPDMERIWDGLALGVGLGGHHLNGKTFRSNLPKLMTARNSVRPLLKKIFRPEWFEQVEKEFHQGLEAELSLFSDDPDGWSRFLLVNRIRRRIAPNDFQLYARKTFPRTPGADSRFLDLVLTVPAQRRKDRGFYIDLYRDRYPEFMKVPMISGDYCVDLPKAGRGRIIRRPWRQGVKEVSQRMGMASLVSGTCFEMGSRAGDRLASATGIPELLSEGLGFVFRPGGG